MAGTSYVIDIAAQMTGQESTDAELDALTSSLMGGGRGAAEFQEALKKLSTDLMAAGAVTARANAALAEGAAHFGTLELAALQAQKALDKAIKRKAGAEEIDRLSASVTAAKGEVDGYVGTLRELEGAAKRASEGEAKLSGQMSNVKKMAAHVDKSLAGQAERLGKLQSAVSSVGGPVGNIANLLIAPTKGFAELSATMGKSRATAILLGVGLGLVVAAVVAMTAALVAGVVAVAAWGVRMADAARSTNLAAEAAEAMRPELAALRPEFDAVSRATGIAVADLRALESTLNAAGVAAADMPGALKAAALAEAALGKGGAAQFVDQIKAGKLAVADFANTAQTKFGGIVARQLMGLDAQSVRMKRNFSDLFSGLNIDSVLGGFETLVGIFDRSSASGRALKTLFEAIFGPIIKYAQEAAYFVEAFALGFLIGVTKIYVAIKPVIRVVQELFGFEDTSLEDACAAVTKVAEFLTYAFVAAAVVFGTVATVIGVVVAALVTFQVAIMAAMGAVAAFVGYAVANVIKFFLDLPAHISNAVAAVSAFGARFLAAISAAVETARAFFAGLNWYDIGANIVRGIANGITGAAGAAMGAIGTVASGLVSRAKSILGIHSPSTVFAAEVGENIPPGIAVGVDESAGVVDQAIVDAVAPSSDLAAAYAAPVVQEPPTRLSAYDALSGNASGAPAPAATPRAPAPAAPSGPSINLSGASFTFNGVENAEQAETRFGELLTRLLEGDALSLGEAVPA